MFGVNEAVGGGWGRGRVLGNGEGRDKKLRRRWGEGGVRDRNGR